MPNSQNGWPVVGPDRIVDKRVLGVEFPNGWLRGDVDVIFTDLITRLHRIEPIHAGWCWGYYVKNIEGSTSISNHASGTAIDYNAPAHPMGTRNTYSAADRAAIRTLLKRYDGVIRWGGDYSGRPDDMHFEINKGRAAVKAVADKIRRESEAQPVALTAADVDLIWNDETTVPGTNPPATRTMRDLVRYLYSLEQIAQRVDTLVDEEGIPAAVAAALDTRLGEIEGRLETVSDRLNAIMSEPVDYPGGPESHPFVMAFRYVQANPSS